MDTRPRHTIVYGGFDPLHSGHIRLFREASKLGSVIVLLHSDKWLTRKKGKPFMAWEERAEILQAIVGVEAVLAVDDGDGTVCNGLLRAKETYPEAELILAFGSDREPSNTPETALCAAIGIEIVWGLGGPKTTSSSKILGEWLADATTEKQIVPKKMKDMEGGPCPVCKTPDLRPISLMDDFEGYLTCKTCGFSTDRWVAAE